MVLNYSGQEQYSGTVKSYDTATGKHYVKYDDGDNRHYTIAYNAPVPGQAAWNYRKKLQAPNKDDPTDLHDISIKRWGDAGIEYFVEKDNWSEKQVQSFVAAGIEHFVTSCLELPLQTKMNEQHRNVNAATNRIMSKQDIVAGIERNEELFTMIVSTDPNKRDGFVGGVAFHKDKVLNARAKSNDRMDFIIESTDHSRLRMTDDSGTCFVFFCRNVGVALVSYR